MVAEAFGIKADTKKSDIGKYFSDIEKTMKTVKEKLQDQVEKNGNYVKIKEVVDTFITGTLDKIADGTKEAAKGAEGSDAIGGVLTAGQDAASADATSVNALVRGIGEIVGVVLKKGEGDAGATKTAEEQQKSIGKLLGEKNNDGTEAHAAAASASIGAVTGADILKAIAKSGDVAGEIEIENAKNAAEIAAGIALRAMAKNGKFASKTGEAKSANAVNGVAASAVGKTLSTLIIAIRNTVDSGLKIISDALAAVKQEDKSADSTTPADAISSGQQQ
ncbi:variable large family protein (plasmid) [Borrelia puertoricensis]|nr:variable large family protein [Borrelia puertoricensis]